MVNTIAHQCAREPRLEAEESLVSFRDRMNESVSYAGMIRIRFYGLAH